MNNRLAVVLPAFNEAAGIDVLIWRIARALDGYDYEIVLVDDGSTDGTAEIVEGLTDRLPLHVIRHGTNRGYGAAIRTGLLAARERADFVVSMDADDSHDPELIPLMIHALGCGSDVIVASRFVPGGREIGVPLHRKILSRGARFVFGRLLRIEGIRDYTCGYRAYRSKFIDELVRFFGEDGFVRETGFTVGVELLLKSDRVGGRLAEIPLVLRYDRKRSASKLRIGRTLAEYVRLLRDVHERDTKSRVSDPEQSRFAGRQSDDGLVKEGTVATVASDVAAVFLSFAFGFAAYLTSIELGVVSSSHPDVLPYLGVAALFSNILVLTFWRFGLYETRLSVLHIGHLLLVSEALTATVAVFFAALFVFGLPHVSRLLVLGAIAMAYPIVLITRSVMTGWLRTRRRRMGSARRVLIYGAGRTGKLLAKKITEAPRLGADVVGFLDDHLQRGSVVRFRTSQIAPTEAKLPVLGTRGDLGRVAEETGAHEIYVTIPDLSDSQLGVIRGEADGLGIELAIVPRIGAVRADQVEVDDIGAIPVLRLHRTAPDTLYKFAKRALDVLAVVILAPFALPVALVTAVAIAIEARPVLFRQTRIGRNGRPFTAWKFRTMRPDVDPYANSPNSDADLRITRIGRLVRMAGIDELPQLINVLRGEMSIVGPRPEMPHIVAEYGELERRRLAVRPGITGLWQLSPDRSQAIHENMEYDLFYLRQRRLAFDLLIIGQTILFAIQALSRSVAAALRELRGIMRTKYGRSGMRRHSVDPDRYVLVALDQRRRPDEPPSWHLCLPHAATLADDCLVKLVVAEKNERRIRELASDPNSRGRQGLEYVGYTGRSRVHDLTKDAGVVVTDLDFVVEWATDRDVAVLQMCDGELRWHPRTGSQEEIADKVRSTFERPSTRLLWAN